MVSNSAKLDRRTKQQTQFGVSVSNCSRDMGWTKSWRKKKEKKMNVDNPIKHPLRGSLIIILSVESNVLDRIDSIPAVGLPLPC